jgi:hypothetical protein
MKQFYYQDGCLSQEDMRRYKTKKIHFVTRRLVHKHIHSCEMCRFLYKQTPSVPVLRRILILLWKLPETILLPFYYMNRSTIVYLAIIVSSIIVTPLLLNVIFSKSGLTIKKDISKETISNFDSKPLAQR